MHSASLPREPSQITSVSKVPCQSQAVSGGGGGDDVIPRAVTGGDISPITVFSNATRTVGSDHITAKPDREIDAVAAETIPFIDGVEDEIPDEGPEGLVKSEADVEPAGETQADSAGDGEEARNVSTRPSDTVTNGRPETPPPPNVVAGGGGGIIDDNGLYEVCLNDESQGCTDGGHGPTHPAATVVSHYDCPSSSGQKSRPRASVTSPRNALLQLVSPNRQSGHLRARNLSILSIFSGRSTRSDASSTASISASLKVHGPSVQSSPPPPHSASPNAGMKTTALGSRLTYSSSSFDRGGKSKEPKPSDYRLIRKAASASEGTFRMPQWMFGVRKNENRANRLRSRSREEATRDGVPQEGAKAPAGQTTIEGPTNAAATRPYSATPYLAQASDSAAAAAKAKNISAAAAAEKLYPDLGTAQQDRKLIPSVESLPDTRSRPATTAVLATTRHVVYLGKHVRRSLSKRILSVLVCGALAKPPCNADRHLKRSLQRRAKQDVPDIWRAVVSVTNERMKSRLSLARWPGRLAQLLSAVFPHDVLLSCKWTSCPT